MAAQRQTSLGHCCAQPAAAVGFVAGYKGRFEMNAGRTNGWLSPGVACALPDARNSLKRLTSRTQQAWLTVMAFFCEYSTSW